MDRMESSLRPFNTYCRMKVKGAAFAEDFRLSLRAHDDTTAWNVISYDGSLGPFHKQFCVQI